MILMKLLPCLLRIQIIKVFSLQLVKVLSGDVLTVIYDITKVGGMIEDQVDSAEDTIAQKEDRLKELDDQLSAVYDRYIRQFSVMESAVTEMNAIRDRIKQTFEYQSNSK